MCKRCLLLHAVLTLFTVLILAAAGWASSEAVLSDFTSPGVGGEFPSPLTPDGAGNFYGTTAIGGGGYGTVFELSPDGSGGWNQTVLHPFTGYLDGKYPQLTPLILDRKGSLYGVTIAGGANEFGVLYRLSRLNGRWREKILYNFASGAGGVYPFSNLVVDKAGNFYGTDDVYHSGGAITQAVFEITKAGVGWTESVIYDTGRASAYSGGGGLAIDAAGNIFLVSSASIAPAIVVKLTPNGKGGWNPAVIYNFAASDAGSSAPILDNSGNLYGTTGAGGANNLGTVYELSPGKNGQWTRTILYSFQGGAGDGSDPFSGVVFDVAGNIYGTTIFGGQSNLGTAFELVALGKGKYQEKVLWSFDGTDGSQPLTNLTLDGGNVYGTTSIGGNNQCYGFEGCGVAYEITP